MERLGIDSSPAVERARARSQSRVGRKRTRSQGPADMEVDGGEDAQEPQKRIHSGKSRYPLLANLFCVPIVTGAFVMS